MSTMFFHQGISIYIYIYRFKKGFIVEGVIRLNF